MKIHARLTRAMKDYYARPLFSNPPPVGSLCTAEKGVLGEESGYWVSAEGGRGEGVSQFFVTERVFRESFEVQGVP